MFSKEEITKQLKNMGAPQDSIVVMHSSLRLIGDVEGGGEGLLSVLVEYFTQKGGLFCVPTHTWRTLFEGENITLDMASEKNCLGTFSTIALKDGRGVRSQNPILSVTVFGDKQKVADFVKDDESITSPSASDSCYGKLATYSGYVLLVGVGQEKNTFLHSVGEILNLPNRMNDFTTETNVRCSDGKIVERKLYMYSSKVSPDVSSRFPKYEMAFRYHGCIRDGFIGNAPTQLCNAVKMKDVVEMIFKNSEGQDPLGTEEPIPPLWYCNK